MDLIKFIPEQLLIVVAATYVVGVFLKQIKMVKDNLIPVILLTFAIVFSLLVAGLSANSALLGILCWGVAVGINQTNKQLEKLKEENN
ncbi:phage holin family protein [Clostridium algidicarnis]|uniref:phage holin family protein n=1 Tax=Clostridium algidicarnis TaxID=37659 RepID=UPI001C0CEFB3|nr:phage holin family protein [Clostridium algidicarnis]MBU3226816.1 phage holin family protein [Clostridium algidicarnis]MBU3250273.1 phage holin family protein [Clostridium algidicarnis]